MELKVRFFCSEMGNEPVKTWIQSLDKEDKAILGEDIKTVQYGWPLGMPLVKGIAKGLFEIRSHLTQGRIARIIFCIHENCIILLHSFIKKTQQITQNDMQISLNRLKQVKQYETTKQTHWH